MEQTLENARSLGVDSVEIIEASKDDLVSALPDAIAACETPLFNLHPVSKLLLARAVAERGYDALITGDGADQVFAASDARNYLPIVGAMVRAAGLRFLSPFFHERIVGWARCHGTDSEKTALREAASAETSRSAVELMLRCMRHRGPDDSGVVVNSHAVLGNARLSMIDRAGGVQPMSSPDGRWHLTYNGEVYNWRELRQDLQDQWTFRTECDTEVVLAALALWGEAALTRFNGMFALFVWDEQTQTGFAARDRLGVKPFVFSCERGVFAFGSEAKALIAVHNTAPRADADAVLEYLVAPCFSGVERPMFATLRPLLPGQSLHVSRAGIELKTWWDWKLPDEWQLDQAGLARNLAQCLERGVQRSLRADHPAGAFLSGGLDSTLLSSLAIRHNAERLGTFTIRFEDQAEFDYSRSLIVRSDDTPHAEAAAREIGTNHSLVPVLRERLSEDLRTLARINDALPAWEQELAQHHLARAAADAGLRCVLVGDAADETHYGYSFLLDAESTRSPGHMLRRFGLPPLNPAFADFKPCRTLAGHYCAMTEAAGYDWNTPLSRLLATTYLVIKRWLPRLLHNGDIHTMAFAVEARLPFADNEVLELSRTVHPSLALHQGCEKSLLRQAARGLMPEASRTRPKSALPKEPRFWKPLSQ